jgi:hypothetical protein
MKLTSHICSSIANADELAGKDLAEVDLAFAEADAAAVRHEDGAIVVGILEFGQRRAVKTR